MIIQLEFEDYIFIKIDSEYTDLAGKRFIISSSDYDSYTCFGVKFKINNYDIDWTKTINENIK